MQSYGSGFRQPRSKMVMQQADDLEGASTSMLFWAGYALAGLQPISPLEKEIR